MKTKLTFLLIILFSFTSCEKNEENENDSNNQSCDIANYEGPIFNTQIDSQCQLAYVYNCEGNQEGVDAACEVYRFWQEQDSSIPDCPYCDSNNSGGNNNTQDKGTYILYTKHADAGGVDVCDDIIVTIEGNGTKTISGYYLSEWGNPTCDNYVEHSSLVKWELDPGVYTVTTNCDNYIESVSISITENGCIVRHYYKY